MTVKINCNIKFALFFLVLLLGLTNVNARAVNLSKRGSSRKFPHPSDYFLYNFDNRIYLDTIKFEGRHLKFSVCDYNLSASKAKEHGCTYYGFVELKDVKVNEHSGCHSSNGDIKSVRLYDSDGDTIYNVFDLNKAFNNKGSRTFKVKYENGCVKDVSYNHSGKYIADIKVLMNI